MKTKDKHRTVQPWTGTVDGIPTLQYRRIEDQDTIVRSTSGTSWLYEPCGPFQFQRFHESGDPMLVGWCVRDSLTEIVNEFARWALPPRKGYAAEIVDESFRQIVCGLWSAGAAWDMGGAWFGVKAVFDEFRRQCVTHEVDIAIWEGQAMTTAPGSGFRDA